LQAAAGASKMVLQLIIAWLVHSQNQHTRLIMELERFTTRDAVYRRTSHKPCPSWRRPIQ